ncbi:hypothetical protein [Rhodococcus sp. ARC_M6]|uniref:hypothetical protein n=1 Tax=Rhodococcus sp. ARC_M6 TaxID=2928852 RepID=UPI001FB3332D|nr:hypothetical protein [Rhodococcus sp. ARC_M6]MCJ0902127.1 hypothetical protein [Rhodococcus sp. ARC_M6]
MATSPGLRDSHQRPLSGRAYASDQIRVQSLSVRHRCPWGAAVCPWGATVVPGMNDANAGN